MEGLGPLFHNLFAFFRFSSIFGGILRHLAFLLTIFSIIEILNGFREVRGEILKGFFDDFWHIFRKYDFVKISVSPRREHENQGFEQ